MDIAMLIEIANIRLDALQHCIITIRVTFPKVFLLFGQG